MAAIALAASSVSLAAPAPPTQIAIQASVDSYLEQQLKDPYSAVRKVVRGPRQAVVKPDVWSTWSGWAICYSINAKNGFGGYTGAKPYLFIFDDDAKIIGVVKNTDDSLWFASVIDRECSRPADQTTTEGQSKAAENPEIPL